MSSATKSFDERRGGRATAANPMSGVSMHVLETEPNVKKSIVKQYPDGRTLSLLVVDEKLVEKSLTFRWDWDLNLVSEEEKKRKSINFKCWANGGLEVQLTYFGDYLIGKMFTLDFALVTSKKLVAEDWQDEVANDIAFPMVNIKRLTMEVGFSIVERDNPFMENLMNEAVVDILSNPENYDKKKKEDHDDKMSAMMGNDRSCDLCGDYPCVWIVQRAVVVANDENEHGHTYNIENKTRRKVGYRHMFRVVNGGPGEKGVRKRIPECVETGVRALFPDDQYMGFMEE
jgi:hypothetical protein